MLDSKGDDTNGRGTSDTEHKHSENTFSLQEIGHLNDRTCALKESHLNYLRRHSELRSILADFTAAILLEKPTSIFPFATEHFAALAALPGPSPPMLIHGPPIFVISGATEISVLDMMNRRFPGIFSSPIMTTTRPPRRGERPGVTMNFATLEMVSADVQAGKYLETGVLPESGCEGELIGTTLEAIARVRSMGAIPLLHISYERAIAVSKCPKIQPMPCIVLVSDESELQHGSDVNFNVIIRARNNLFGTLVATVNECYREQVQGRAGLENEVEDG